MIDRANASDQDAFKILEASPITLEKLQRTGLAFVVREMILDALLPDQDRLYTRHRLKLEPQLLAKQLAGPNPTPLERLLAEQASLDYMALRVAECHEQKRGTREVIEIKITQDRVASAHRRFLASLRTLAQVRKLQLPDVLQVNIGDKQVNVSAA